MEDNNRLRLDAEVHLNKMMSFVVRYCNVLLECNDHTTEIFKAVLEITINNKNEDDKINNEAAEFLVLKSSIQGLVNNYEYLKKEAIYIKDKISEYLGDYILSNQLRFKNMSLSETFEKLLRLNFIITEHYYMKKELLNIVENVQSRGEFEVLYNIWCAERLKTVYLISNILSEITVEEKKEVIEE